MKNRLQMLVLTGLLGFQGAVVADTVLYIQSSKAALMSAPEFKAEKLAVLAKGTGVTAVQTTASWTEVNHGGQTGWIATMLLGATPPLNTIQLNPPREDHPGQKARKRSSVQATAAATRGLTDQFRQRSLEPHLPNYQAVQQMETQKVEEPEVDEFRKALAK